MTKNEISQKQPAIVLGLTLVLLIACAAPGPTGSSTPVATMSPTTAPLPAISPGPTPTLTEEQLLIASISAYFGSNLTYSRADCIQAVNNGTKKGCAFITNMGLITKPEWEHLFPDTLFYLVDIGSWRSNEGLLAHEGPDGGTSRHLIAWQDKRAYYSDTFGRLLEANAVTITGANRELVARSFALVSIPNYLGGDVLFLEWGDIEPGTYSFKYSHYLKAWTEVWGCEILWWFVFTDQHMPIVSRSGGACSVSTHGDYVEDTTYFQFDCEAVPLGVPPPFKDYRLKR